MDDLTSGSSIKIENLQPALSVVNEWEADLMHPETDDNKEYAEYERHSLISFPIPFTNLRRMFRSNRFLIGEFRKSRKAVEEKGSYIPKFSKRMMDVVAESNAFPYPHLLPKIPFRMDFREKSSLSEFVPIED